MSAKILKVAMIIICTIVILTCIVVVFTRDISGEDYPVYISGVKDEDLDKSPETVNGEVKGINYAVPIFMYHWVRDEIGDYPYPENMVSPSTLSEQCQYIVNNGYESIYVKDIENITEYTKPVALTFDDGFICFYLYAFPILKQFNVKSTLFVITDYVGTPGYCTKEQLLEMKESGIVDIQAHTKTHPHLAWLSVQEMYNQMNDCNTYLKEQLGIDSTMICYPYGSYNANTIEQAKKIGYKYGFAMDGGVYYSNRDDDYEISRIYAYRSMNINTFASYCSKSYVNVNW